MELWQGMEPAACDLTMVFDDTMVLGHTMVVGGSTPSLP